MFGKRIFDDGSCPAAVIPFAHSSISHRPGIIQQQIHTSFKRFTSLGSFEKIHAVHSEFINACRIDLPFVLSAQGQALAVFKDLFYFSFQISCPGQQRYRHLLIRMVGTFFLCEGYHSIVCILHGRKIRKDIFL